MALEPRTIAVEEAPNPRLIAVARRFWVSPALTVPVVVIAVVDLIPGRPLDPLLSKGAWRWVEFALVNR